MLIIFCLYWIKVQVFSQKHMFFLSGFETLQKKSAETSGAFPALRQRYTDIAKVAPLAQAAEERGLHWLLGGVG